MKDGFIKVVAGDIALKVADTKFNAEQIKESVKEADQIGANLLVLPELCVTGYTCGDLFFSQTLQDAALSALIDIKNFTKGKYPVVVVGVPMMYGCKLYNCAAVLCGGKILGVVPKTHLPNHGEFAEKRQFASFDEVTNELYINIDSEDIPFGNDILFAHENMPNYTFGVEICEDLWAMTPPSLDLCRAGATIICNPSASNEIVGKEDYRRLLVKSTSAKFLCGYVYANSGYMESTQDMVFASHHIVAENGTILAENKPFGNSHLVVTDIDVDKVVSERQKNTGFNNICGKYRRVLFSQKVKETKLTRKYAENPFVPKDEAKLKHRIETILNIQSYGLARRVQHTNAKTLVVGVSGGLDSTLALLVMVRAMDILKRSRKDILAITMPCFGTTKRTKSNSEKLCELLGVTFKEVDITKSVEKHFADIGQDPKNFDVTFENSQARERTQVLMDYSNKENGFVVGTGDLSELALGWATYNGDHMSMYAVNASVPKTMIRHIVRYEMSNADQKLAEVLADILDTPVSPELLPVDKDGNMTQKTEDLVGPYELHDFFLYHFLRCGEDPSKIYRIAIQTFDGTYNQDTIKHWLKIFVKRFIIQQFKRSCMPDGPKVGSVALSPRGDLKMPSDATSTIWLDDIE